jgi:uncharacterized RDD family membrane protein YckC
VAAALDNIFGYQTPEGIELRHAVSGPLARGLAWLVDLAIKLTAYLIIGFVLAWAGGVGVGLILIFIFLVEWFYPVFFEKIKGATPGKKIFGLLVIHDDGTPLSWNSAVIRNLLRTIDFLPLFNITGLITMLCNNRFKRLGDFAAGTVVVYGNQATRRPKIADASPQPPPQPLTLEEQRCILDFCERTDRLSLDRRHELARLVPSLANSSEPERKLLAYGNWLMHGGKRA